MTKYLFLAIAILTIALGASARWALWERDGRIEMAGKFDAQKKETAAAIQRNKDLRDDHDKQTALQSALLEAQKNETTELQRRNRAVQATNSTLSRALSREPARAGRVSSYLERRGMRDICRSFGGTKDQCAIEIPKSAAAKPADPVQRDPAPDSGMGGDEAPGGGLAVHEQSRLREFEDMEKRR